MRLFQAVRWGRIWFGSFRNSSQFKIGFRVFSLKRRIASYDARTGHLRVPFPKMGLIAARITEPIISVAILAASDWPRLHQSDQVWRRQLRANSQTNPKEMKTNSKIASTKFIQHFSQKTHQTAHRYYSSDVRNEIVWSCHHTDFSAKHSESIR